MEGEGSPPPPPPPLLMVSVRFHNGAHDRMPLKDVVVLRRHLRPLSLPYVQSEAHFRKFQSFVEKAKEVEAQPAPPGGISEWQRQFMDEIVDLPALQNWTQLARRTQQDELTRILNLRAGELAQLAGVDQ